MSKSEILAANSKLFIVKIQHLSRVNGKSSTTGVARELLGIGIERISQEEDGVRVVDSYMGYNFDCDIQEQSCDPVEYEEIVSKLPTKPPFLDEVARILRVRENYPDILWRSKSQLAREALRFLWYENKFSPFLGNTESEHLKLMGAAKLRERVESIKIIVYPESELEWSLLEDLLQGEDENGDRVMPEGFPTAPVKVSDLESLPN
jgi:hypothetical protein